MKRETERQRESDLERKNGCTVLAQVLGLKVFSQCVEQFFFYLLHSLTRGLHSLGNLQGPCGFDAFSYSWRDVDGSKYHLGKGEHAQTCTQAQAQKLSLSLSLSLLLSFFISFFLLLSSFFISLQRFQHFNIYKYMYIFFALLISPCCSIRRAI